MRMSGRPFMQDLERRIEEQGGEDAAVFIRMADGEGIRAIAESLGVSRPYLYMWRNRKEHAERRQSKWADAMRLSAHANAEKSIEELERLDGRLTLTNADVSLAKAKSEYRRWLAGVRDKELYGDAKDAPVQINVSVNQLHLDALRARGSMALAQERRLEIQAASTPNEEEAEA